MDALCMQVIAADGEQKAARALKVLSIYLSTLYTVFITVQYLSHQGLVTQSGQSPNQHIKYY